MNTSKVTPVFKVRDLSKNEMQRMMQEGVWKEECPVPLERLNVVEFSYWHLEKDNSEWHFHDSRKHDGNIIVLDAVAGHVRDIFKELYEIKFPIHKACPIETYKGDDEASMADNNSSSFNYREITGGGLPSIHSYGLAIDMNPIQNPYVSFLEDKDTQGTGNTKILPSSGRDYMNRTNLRLGMIENATKSVVEIFKDHGFPIWGGAWNTPIDWQHFQTHRSMAHLLGAMTSNDASVLFDMYVKNPNILESVNFTNNEFSSLYNDNPKRFMELLDENFLKMNFKDAGGLIKTKQYS